MHQPGSTRTMVSTFGTLYSCLFCMLASSVLIQMPLLGGALYLLGRVAVLCTRMRRPPSDRLLPRRFVRTGNILFVAVTVLMLAIVVLFPAEKDSHALWLVVALALMVSLRPIVLRFVIERDFLQNMRVSRAFGRALVIDFSFLAGAGALLLSALKSDQSWALLGGFLFSGVLEFFDCWRVRRRIRPVTDVEEAELKQLHRVHAYRMYQTITLVTAAALQVTLLMAFCFIGVTAQALLACMALAVSITYGATIATSLILRKQFLSNHNPSSILMIGLVVWLYGLCLFIGSRSYATPAIAYIALMLCTAGATVCIRTNVHNESDMRAMAAFGIGHTPSESIDWVQEMRVEFASTLGQMIVLIGMPLIILFTRNVAPDTALLSMGLRLLFAVPALVLVAAAALITLRFPVTRQHIEKLRRYTSLHESGGSNAPLHEQLEAVIVRKSIKRFGVQAIMCLMRPFYRHKIIGRENVRLSNDAGSVFVCNHGEIYGPIVTNLYIPFDFRPWVTYEMADIKAVADHVYNGTMLRQKWIPEKWRRPLTDRLAAPFLVWIMRSVDSIPVYHDNPRKLIQTFRTTISAMEAGDSILLFPENSATSEDGRFQHEGVSEFFTGFAVIGQLFYQRTRKCAQFIPVYADKQKRIISFGAPTFYNPDLPTNDEKQRLCDALRGEMLRMAKENKEN